MPTLNSHTKNEWNKFAANLRGLDTRKTVESFYSLVSVGNRGSVALSFNPRSCAIIGDFNPTAEPWFDEKLKFGPAATVLLLSGSISPDMPAKTADEIEREATLLKEQLESLAQECEEFAGSSEVMHVSECCSAEMAPESGFCPMCHEHATAVLLAA